MDLMGSEISNFPSLVRDKTILEESSLNENLVKEDVQKKMLKQIQDEIFIQSLEQSTITGNDLSNRISLKEIKYQNSLDQILSSSLHSSRDSKIEGESQNDSTPNEWELNISHIPESSKDELIIGITRAIFDEETDVNNSKALLNHKANKFPSENEKFQNNEDGELSSSSYNKSTTNGIQNSVQMNEEFHDNSFSNQSPSKVLENYIEYELRDETQDEANMKIVKKPTEEEINEDFNLNTTTVYLKNSQYVLDKTYDLENIDFQTLEENNKNVEDKDFKDGEDISNISEPVEVEKNSLHEDLESLETKCQLNMGYMPMDLIYSTVRMKELEMKCKEYKQELDFRNKLFIEKEAECLRLKEEITVLKDQLKNVKTAIGVETNEDSLTDNFNKQKSQDVTNGHSIRSCSRKSPISLRNRNNLFKISHTEKIDKKESLRVEEEYLKRFAKKGLSSKKLVKKPTKERKLTKENKINKSKEVLDDIGIFCFSPESKKFKESNPIKDSSKLVKRSKSEKKYTETNFDGIGVICFRSETQNQKKTSNRESSTWVKRKKMPCKAQRTRSISPVNEEDERIARNKANKKLSSRRKLKFDF